MGNSESGTKRMAATRRYSRASGFTHWMDNIKDRRSIKIKMSRGGDKKGGGTFTLVYSDDSSDDFISIKSTFTFTGTFVVLEGDVDPFGIKIPVNIKGNVVADEEENLSSDKAPVKRSESLVGRRGTTAPKDRLIDEDKFFETVDSSVQSSKTTVDQQRKLLTKFETKRLTCKLNEGGVSATWIITQANGSNDKSDCLEPTKTNSGDVVSWPWTGSGTKETHIAPSGTIDFMGEEDLDSGAMDLKIRIPQLAAGWTPPVVILTEVGGWKLEKTWR